MFGLFGGPPSAADIRRNERRKILQDVRTVQGTRVGLDPRGLDKLPGFYLENPSAYTWSTSPYAPSDKYESAGFQVGGYVGSGKGQRGSGFYLFKERPDRMAELRAEQQRLAGIQQKQYETQQADIAKQLKIVQGEKSAVAKMQEDYSNMLIAEAQRRKEAQEQAARDLEAQRRSAQAGAANRLMEGRTANLQIQQASSAPRTGGTQQFRRRVIQQGTASPYKGLSTIQSGMVNV
tara:strand:+ start:45 stop:749 length:705 start_codon:yes stop_codon:yes gene_type:complete